MNNDVQSSSVQSYFFHKLFLVVLKRKTLVITIFASVVIGVTVLTFMWPAIYEASCTILLEKDSYPEKAMLFRISPASEGYDWIKAELEILQSYPVLMKVVRELGLEHEPSELHDGNRELALEKALKRFREKIKVDHSRNTNIVRVSYESTSPELAAETANRVVQEYLAYRSDVFDESKSFQFLENQMQVADEQLRLLEENLAEFKDNEELLSPSFQGEILLTKLADFQKSLTAVRTRIINKEAKLSVIIEQLEEQSDPIIPSTEASNSLSNEKYLTKLKGELLDMEIERDKLLQRFTPNYEGVVELENQISAAKEIIRGEIEKIIEQEKAEIRALKAEENALLRAIDEINIEVKDFARKEFEFNQISRGLEDNQEIYSMLLKQREESRISLAKIERGIKVKTVSPAVIPQKPSRPRKRLNLMLGLILAFLTSLGIPYLLESAKQTISSAKEMARLTGIPVLGTVPEIQGRGLEGRGQSTRNS